GQGTHQYVPRLPAAPLSPNPPPVPGRASGRLGISAINSLAFGPVPTTATRSAPRWRRSHAKKPTRHTMLATRLSGKKSKYTERGKYRAEPPPARYSGVVKNR